MTAINWVSLFLGFFLLFMTFLWLTGEISARRRHREKVQLIQLGHNSNPTDGNGLEL